MIINSFSDLGNHYVFPKLTLWQTKFAIRQKVLEQLSSASRKVGNLFRQILHSGSENNSFSVVHDHVHVTPSMFKTVGFSKGKELYESRRSLRQRRQCPSIRHLNMTHTSISTEQTDQCDLWGSSALLVCACLSLKKPSACSWGLILRLLIYLFVYDVVQWSHDQTLVKTDLYPYPTSLRTGAIKSIPRAEVLPSSETNTHTERDNSILLPGICYPNQRGHTLSTSEPLAIRSSIPLFC